MAWTGVAIDSTPKAEDPSSSRSRALKTVWAALTISPRELVLCQARAVRFQAVKRRDVKSRKIPPTTMTSMREVPWAIF